MNTIDWKEMHDMQQKLVVHYVLENEKLKDRIKELEKPSEKVGLQALGNKVRICLESIGYEWRNDKK